MEEEVSGQMMPRSPEMGGGELVCRLVAATPPYLYSPAGLPHAFFFSQLLRGLVEARAKRPPSPGLCPGQPRVSKRLRSVSGSAFTAPQPGTGKSGDSQNPLSISRILPHIDSIYKSVRQTRSEASPSIGIELVVDYVKGESEPSKQLS